MSLNTGNAILSNAISVDSSYNVGIGTSSPTSNANYTSLDIRGTNGSLIYMGSTVNSSLRLVGEGTDAYIDNLTASGSLLFRTGASSPTTRLTIASTGAATFSSSVTAGDLISTSYGSARVQVTSTTNSANAGLRLSAKDSAGTTKNAGLYYVAGTTTATTFMSLAANDNDYQFNVLANGNVGIGTSSPTYKLVVSNGGAEGFEFIPAFGTNINVLQNYNRATSTWGTFDVRANDYVFRNQGTAALTIASTGAATFSSSVQSPSLIVAGSGYFPAKLITLGGAEFSRYNANIGTNLVNGSQIALSFGTRSNNVDYDNTLNLLNGNVGIGSTSVPRGRLYVNSNTETDVIAIQNTLNTGAFIVMADNVTPTWDNAPRLGAISNDMVFRTVATERMRITSGGQVLINTSSDSYGDGSALVTQSNKGATIQTTAGGGYCALVLRRTASDGGLTEHYYQHTYVGGINISTTSTSYGTSSDYRLKEDLKEINGLEKVSAIKVYDFKWKTSGERNDGVLAHELADVLPYAVLGEKDGEKMQGVDYSKIVPVLVKAIQEQQAQIEAQQQQINSLINR